MINIKSYGSGSKGNLYLVSNSQTNIILECGLNMQSIKKMLNDNKLQFSNINACVVSHEHIDHSLSINELNEYNIMCYCTNETKKKYNLDDDYTKILYDDKVYRIGSIQMLSFKVNHGNTTCFGFIFKDKENLKLFITDFMTMNKNLSKFKFDEIFIECNYINELLESNKKNNNEFKKYDRQINTHLELSNLVILLKSKLFDLTNCEKINLIHISSELGDKQIMKDTIEQEFGIECVVLKPNGEEF